MSNDSSSPKPRGKGSPRDRAIYGGGQKQPKSYFFNDEKGSLFVPLQTMWLVRDAAVTIRAKGGEPTLDAIAHELDEPERNVAARVSHWEKHLHPDLPWLPGWRRGQEPPPGTVVATRQEIELCTHAWDYPSICHEAHNIFAKGLTDRRKRIRSKTYSSWVRGVGNTPAPIRNRSMRLWLYGGPAPRGVFVADARLRRLRW
jgi:hypothetical protein